MPYASFSFYLLGFVFEFRQIVKKRENIPYYFSLYYIVIPPSIIRSIIRIPARQLKRIAKTQGIGSLQRETEHFVGKCKCQLVGNLHN